MVDAVVSGPAVGDAEGPRRIRVLPPELADQIAAGEVVERPASILKELLDNAIDAGATRIDLELVAGGTAKIVVVDDGGGIEPADLQLAITRHATSKLVGAAELIEPPCLGFRGEALASIAAVAHVVIESRTPTAGAGTRLTSHPGLPPALVTCAHPGGTRIEISNLFANVPARRKFLRSVATELSHCVETVTRVALVHPHVGVRLRHEGRIVFDVARGDEDARVAGVLGRRGATDLRRFAGEFEGIGVRAWVGDGDAERADVLVVVRRRVIRERAIAQIVREAWLGARSPCACIVVEPPHGTVDVNVHPQKSEVRFAEPQRVYAAVRRAMATLDRTPLAIPEAVPIEPVRPVAVIAGTLSLPLETRADDAPLPSSPPTAYVLRTRAIEADYAAARDRLHAEARALATLTTARAEPARSVEVTAPSPGTPAPESAAPEPDLIDCLPGPIALMRWQDDLLAVDLRVLRTHLLRRRLLAELGGGALAGQALLIPAVVQLGPDEVVLVEEARAELENLGLVVDRFGDGAVVVRTIPAELRRCVDDIDAAAVLARVLPYLRARRRDSLGPADAANVLAACAGSTVAARFARRFVREAMDEGLAVDDIPGIRRWRPDELVAGR
jgi:DNA mismatch repair protein MutL